MAEDKGKQDEDDTGSDNDDDDEPEEEYVPPTREEWESLSDHKTRLSAEAKKWRLRATGKDPKWVPRTPEKDTSSNGSGAVSGAKEEPKVDVAAERRKAEEETAAKYKAPLVRTASRAAFQEAGLVLPATKSQRDAAFNRVMKLIDLDEIDVDDDGSISGVEDQVKAIKRDYPELFTKKGGKAIDAGAGSGANAGQEPRTKSADKLAKMLTGG